MLERSSFWDLGQAKFDWWLDWRGSTVAIIASGPSAKSPDIARLRDRARVIAIKENVELAPWADVVYGCDAPWWRNCQGLPKFNGLRVAYAGDLRTTFPAIRLIDIKKQDDRILLEQPAVLGSGGNSGFQALNLAIQFGAVRVILIGFDMHDRSGVHWYGRANGAMRRNPDENNFRRWRRAFHLVAKPLADMGIEVVNASTMSDLTCFRRLSIVGALAEWSDAGSN